MPAIARLRDSAHRFFDSEVWFSFTSSKVTMLAGALRPGWDVAPTFKWRHAAWVKELGIRVLRGAAAEGWDYSGRLRLRWEPESSPPEAQERPDALDLDGHD